MAVIACVVGSAVDRFDPVVFGRGPRVGFYDGRSVCRSSALPPRAIRPRGMDAGRMKPAGARQFEAARPLPCREASDTKVFAKALLAANHARDGKLSDVSFADRSEEHTSELQSLMRISYAVFCLKKKKKQLNNNKQDTK